MAKVYIDKGRLIMSMNDWMLQNAPVKAGDDTTRADTILDAIKLVEDIHAVDAVEVRHGRWVHVMTHEMHDEYGGLVGEAYCSECKLFSSQLSHDGRVGYLYCPRCGAIMDLKGS